MHKRICVYYFAVVFIINFAIYYVRFSCAYASLRKYYNKLGLSRNPFQ